MSPPADFESAASTIPPPRRAGEHFLLYPSRALREVRLGEHSLFAACVLQALHAFKLLLCNNLNAVTVYLVSLFLTVQGRA